MLQAPYERVQTHQASLCSKHYFMSSLKLEYGHDAADFVSSAPYYALQAVPEGNISLM